MPDKAENEAPVEAEDQFDKAFDDLPDEPEVPDPDAAKSDDGEDKGEQKGDPPDDKKVEDPKPDESDTEVPDVTLTDEYKALEKRFKDTQGWGTKLSQEIKDLKEKIEQSGEAGPDGEIPEEVKEFLQDYPELEAAVKHIAGEKGDSGEFKTEIDQMRGELAQANYNSSLIGGYMDGGKYVPGHPDAWEMMAMPEFQAYIEAEKESGNDLMLSGAAADGIKFITQFKESLLDEASKEADAKRKGAKDKADDALASSPDEKSRKTPDVAEGQKELQSQEEEFDKEFDAIP